MTSVSAPHIARPTTVDVLVVGAGIVGVSIAAHLGRRGIRAALIDRGDIAAETSFGNLGLVERASLYPPAFPRSLREIATYARNRQLDARYNVSALPRIAPWLFKYWRNSSALGRLRAFTALKPLFERSIFEHMSLAEYAGTVDLYRPGGWLSLYRTPDRLTAAVEQASLLADHGLSFGTLDANELATAAPDLAREFAGAVHTQDPLSTSDPRAVSLGIAERWLADGGVLARGRAESLHPRGTAWAIDTESGPLIAGQAVIALGPWSDSAFHRLGYRFPLGWKRGYHMTYASVPGAKIGLPLVDVEHGYAIVGMKEGIRLGTGVEFGLRDGSPTPVQLANAERIARRIFPLGERLKAPWMGSRPFMADMIPVIGSATRHPGLWFAFGHGHHGFTHGPATGRLVAELIDGTPTFCNAAPFSPRRFD